MAKLKFKNENGQWQTIATNTTDSTSDAVKYTEQTLTEEQKAQARTNIGVTDKKVASYIIGSTASNHTLKDCDYLWENSRSTIINLMSGSNRKFIFREGQYTVISGIYLGRGTVVEGMGIQNTIFKSINNSTGLSIFLLGNNSELKNFTIEGYSHTANTGVYISGHTGMFNHILVSDVKIKSCKHGIYINLSDSVTIQNSIITSCSNCVQLEKSGLCEINNNIIQPYSTSSSYYAISILGSHNFNILNNTILNSYYGIYMGQDTNGQYPQKGTISHNYIYSSSAQDLYGIYYNGSQNASTSGFHFIIADNRIKFLASSTKYGYAIYLIGCSYTNIRGNDISTKNGISIRGSGSKNLIVNNIIDCTSTAVESVTVGNSSIPTGILYAGNAVTGSTSWHNSTYVTIGTNI